MCFDYCAYQTKNFAVFCNKARFLDFYSNCDENKGNARHEIQFALGNLLQNKDPGIPADSRYNAACCPRSRRTGKQNWQTAANML